MRKIITGILILLLSAVTSQAVYADSVGKFVKVEGRVDITRPGEPAELVNVGTEIFEKDIIRSKSNSKAEILFRDGNVLRLAQRTRVEVSEYISDSSKRSTILNLFRGKIQNKVKKLLGSIFGDDENRYEVHTPTSVCGVRGTDFFMTYEKGVSGATFKEGFGYGYNRNQPENMIEVQAGQSMIIPDSNATPVLRTSSTAEISRLEGETTPADEEGESIDEEDSSGQMDNNGDEGESVNEEEGTGEDEGVTEEGDTEEGDSESVGEETSDTADEGSSAEDEAEMADSGTEQVESGSDSTDTGTSPEDVAVEDSSGTEGGSATGDSGFVSIDAGSSESGIDDGGIDGLDTGDAFMDTVLADDQSENTDSNIVTVSTDQEDATLGSNDGPEILIQDAGDGDCPEGEDCDNAYSAIVDLLTTSLDSDSTTDPTPTDPTPTDQTPTDPTPTDPVVTDPIPAPIMAVSGKLMGLASGRHYQGEYLLPPAEDPRRSEFPGRTEGDRYEYEYFVMNDGVTYLRGVTDHETMDPVTGAVTWTMVQYLPDGTRLTQIEAEGDFNPQFTESTWTGSLASLADPPSAGYFLRYSPDPFDTTVMTGIGSFAGEISGIAAELWSATLSAPADISFSGQYTSPGDPFTLFKSPLSGSFADGGTYSGIFSGYEAGAKGFIHALYINPEGTELGILKSEFTGLVDADGNWNSTMYPTVMSNSPGSINNDNFLASVIEDGYLEVERLAGSFSDSSVEGIKAHGMGNTMNITGYDWGLFNLALGYAKYDEAAAASAWSGSISGFGMFGEDDTGMWKADIAGSWLADGISGDLNGKFLTMTKMGTIEGNLVGPAGSAGDWSAMSQGTWQKTGDLQFSSSVDGHMYFVRSQVGGSSSMVNGSVYSYHYDLYSHEGGYEFYNAADNTDTYYQINAMNFDGTTADFNSQKWVYDHTSYAFIDYAANPEPGFLLQSLEDADLQTGLTWDYTDPQWTNYNMFDSGWFEGILGGLQSPWSATSSSQAGLTLLGFYEVPFYIVPGQPVIFAIDIESYNPSNVTGAYSGYMGGVLASSIQGNISAIYIAPDNTAGILLGQVNGAADSMSGIWEASGGIYPVQLYSGVGATPVSLLDGVDVMEYHFWENNSYTYPEQEGGFFDGTGSTGNFDVGGGHFFTKRISGQSWGVWQNVLGGVYDGTPGSDWTMNLYHEMYDNLSGVIAKYSVSGGTWSGNQIEADVLGAWVDLKDAAVGVSSGKIEGTYDPTEMTWQTAGSGAWLSPGQLIDMAANSPAALTALNIPAYEVGRANLSGASGSGSYTVAMNDVIYFSSSTGGDPRIWATDSISGNYTTTPYDGEMAALSGSGLSADFIVKNWDSVNGTWTAEISNGSGTLTRTDATTVGIAFDGVAGGSIDSASSFTGEGAGNVR